MKKLIFVALYALGTLFLMADNLSPEEINDFAIHSEDPQVSLGLTAGTLGFGVNISKPINNFTSVRFNMNKFNLNVTDDSRFSSVLKSNKKYNFNTKGLLLDFHLLQLRFTGGLYLNKNTITYRSKPKGKQAIVFNGKRYGIEKIVKVDSTISFNTISPYVGLGWGNNGNKDGWNLSLDIGLMYHGKPKIDIAVKTKKGLPSVITDAINSSLEVEKRKQEKKLSDFPFYPVIMIGMSYSF